MMPTDDSMREQVGPGKRCTYCGGTYGEHTDQCADLKRTFAPADDSMREARFKDYRVVYERVFGCLPPDDGAGFRLWCAAADYYYLAGHANGERQGMEKAAKVCDEMYDTNDAPLCAAAIRSRARAGEGE